VDGPEAQRGEVEAAMARHRADTVVIQDFVHALEYRWKAAYCFHAEGTCEAEAWVMEHALARNRLAPSAKFRRNQLAAGRGGAEWPLRRSATTWAR
jgi:hypothetical protein